MLVYVHGTISSLLDDFFSSSVERNWNFGIALSEKMQTTSYVRVPEKPMKKCTGLTYCGAKLPIYLSLPGDIRETQETSALLKH